MNILAVDYGKKRIGLAWADTDINVVLPFGVVSNLEELKEVIKKEKIDKIVFGLPLYIDGSENKNTKKIKQLACELYEDLKIKVDFFDESFTTAEARKTEGDVSLDEKAAIIILEDYLK